MLLLLLSICVTADQSIIWLAPAFAFEIQKSESDIICDTTNQYYEMHCWPNGSSVGIIFYA